ncbi:MAG TPA: hypothetical protein DCL21_06690, partial [Alphaproteobacteria bacterium]|nr:hypothetical protein [Alphaproteobacteria bacterium]
MLESLQMFVAVAMVLLATFFLKFEKSKKEYEEEQSLKATVTMTQTYKVRSRTEAILKRMESVSIKCRNLSIQKIEEEIYRLQVEQ